MGNMPRGGRTYRKYQLTKIAFIDRTAELALIIGDQKHWGKGVGTMAASQILEHGFNKLGLRRYIAVQLIKYRNAEPS